MIFAEVTYSVILAKARRVESPTGIQNFLKFLNSGSPPAVAGVARHDDFHLVSRVLLEPHRKEFSLFSFRKQEIKPQ